MRKRTVKSGLNLILAGVVSITLATFYHTHIARILFLSLGTETILVLLGILLGGILCLSGILVAFVGLLRKAGNTRDVRLSYNIILLAAALVIFFFLFSISVSNNEQPGSEPGESITI